jgi:hypothetical protein
VLRVRPARFQALAHYDGWPDLHFIVVVYLERRLPDLIQSETTSFLSSLPADAKRIAAGYTRQ